MAGRESVTQVTVSREQVRTNPPGADLNSRRLARRVHAKDGMHTNPPGADLNSRRLARRVHAKDGMHTCAGLAIEENHRKWFSSQTLSGGRRR